MDVNGATLSVSKTQLDLVRQVCHYIEQTMPQEPTLAELSERVHVSQYHLQRTFKRVMGISPRQYAEARRLDCLKSKLRETSTVTDAMYEVGYSSSSRLYEGTREKMGMTPAIYRSGGAGMYITYTIVEVEAFGRMLVASTEHGICSVDFGDNDEALAESLFEEYPAATIIHDDESMCNWVISLVEHLRGWRPHLDLPLDVQATAFQRRVWQELQRIPYGETRTYSQIAEAIGQPNATRAVARACATNPTALLTPCHRVVRSDGSMGGYKWGLERKHALLEQERHYAHAQETAGESASERSTDEE
jgi:AraC family transcriptional regulator, regulatory protein of adaptative response / methylated-DNA-[protein]-cysteine methyltransferase